MSQSAMTNLRSCSLLVVICLLGPSAAISHGQPPRQDQADSMAYLAWDSAEMTAFARAFKAFIVHGCKTTQFELAQKDLSQATRIVDRLIERTGADRGRARARLRAIRGLIEVARARVALRDKRAACEVSVAIRSEWYLLHDELGLLGPEDHMIYFHNAIIHRLEPLIAARRYGEMERLLPRMERVLKSFESPPAGVADAAAYRQRYARLAAAVARFAEAVRAAGRYIDPENGALLVQGRVEDALAGVHKAFAPLYLGFPAAAR